MGAPGGEDARPAGARRAGSLAVRGRRRRASERLRAASALRNAAIAEAMLCSAASSMGDFQAAEAALADARQALEGIPDRRIGMFVDMARGDLLFDRGRTREAARMRR